MTVLQRAAQTLIDAEAALKRLIGEAVERGEYSSVEMLARWASKVGAIYSEEKNTIPKNDIPIPSNTQDRPSPATVLKRKAPSKTSGHPKRRAYPIFTKSGDVLVKIAWSKSSKSEYQHKSPRMVTKMLAESLAYHARSGAIVSMDKILPLKADDGSEIPDYQVYVSLAWLKQIDTVKQNGRQGYIVKKRDEFSQQIAAAWSKLPEITQR